jgi:hypothetical protein
MKVAVLSLLGGLACAGIPAQRPDPFVGTWKLNVAKSKTLQYMEAFRPLILLVESQVVRYLKMQFKVRKQRATENDQLAKTVSRATPGVDLDPHLGSLKSQLGRRKKVKAGTTAPKTPAPSSTSTTPATPADPAKTVK